MRDRHADALRRLLDYDRPRQAAARAGRSRSTCASAATSPPPRRRCTCTPNTLRQRLRRITELTQLDVRTDDWLMIEIALKLLRLEELVP